MTINESTSYDTQEKQSICACTWIYNWLYYYNNDIPFYQGRLASVASKHTFTLIGGICLIISSSIFIANNFFYYKNK